MKPDLLFVYGSLKRGSSAAERSLLDVGARFVGEGSAAGMLYDLGDYPGMVPGEAGRVQGELYQMLDPERLLRLLDDYEDVRPDGSGEYVRKNLTVTPADGGTSLDCWAYLYNGRPDTAARLGGGVWKP